MKGKLVTLPSPASLSRRALLRAVPLAGAAALAACTTTTTAKKDRAKISHPLEGVTDFAGAPIVLPAVFERVTLIDFWASWCQPCRLSFRHLDQLYRTFVDNGLEMLAISVDDDPLAAKRFSSSFRPRFPLGWDPSGDVRDRFGVGALPSTILLEGRGMVAFRSEGFDEGRHRLLEDEIRRLLRVG